MTNQIPRDDVLQQMLKSATLPWAQCPLQLGCRKGVGMLLFSKMQNIAAPPRHSEASFASENSKPGIPSQGIGNVLWLEPGTMMSNDVSVDRLVLL